MSTFTQNLSLMICGHVLIVSVRGWGKGWEGHWHPGGELGVRQGWGGDRGEGTEPGLMSAKGQEEQGKWSQQSLARPLFQDIVL